MGSASVSTVKGHLDMLLLAVLADGPSHGYAVIEQLRTRSADAFDLPEGTVYPALHRLERSGLLASDWDSSAGRPRRVYRITSRGRSRLGEQRAAWAEFAEAVTYILEGKTWTTPARAIIR